MSEFIDFISGSYSVELLKFFKIRPTDIEIITDVNKDFTPKAKAGQDQGLTLKAKAKAWNSSAYPS